MAPSPIGRNSPERTPFGLYDGHDIVYYIIDVAGSVRIGGSH